MDYTKTNDEQRIISLCTGIRGLERGIERSGTKIKPVAYVEIEAFSCFNLVAAMESGVVDKAPVWTDLKTFDGRPFRNRVHGIVGGYPCQPFSVSGKQKGESDPRHLWPYISEIIKSVRPIWCFFENVPGHINMGFGNVYKDLRSMGYKVEAGIFSAEEVGAPHVRKRLFILAYANGYGHVDDAREVQRTSSEVEKKAQRENGKRVRGESVTICKELADATSSKPTGLYERTEKKQSILRKSSKELGNANCKHRRLSGSKERLKDAKVARSSKKLADTYSIRCNESEHKTESRIAHENVTKWPTRPGEKQHEWEEPRTAAKCGLGCTIDGYNFRTDILRALGNAVVEQTAEKAWRELNKLF